jgi:hypothetical protein
MQREPRCDTGSRRDRGSNQQSREVARKRKAGGKTERQGVGALPGWAPELEGLVEAPPQEVSQGGP